MSEEQLPAWLEVAIAGGTSAGAAGVAFLLATGLGEPQGAMLAASAAPAARRALAAGAQRIRQRWFEQAEQAVDEAATIAGLEPEEVARRLVATSARGELFWEAVQAAAHAGVEAKVTAIGKALARGAVPDDSMVVDHERLFVQAMAEFELPHIWLLERIAKAQETNPMGISTHELGELPWLVPEDRFPLLATLQRRAAVQAHGGPILYGRSGQARWSAIEFGFACLDRLREAGLKEEGDAG